MQRKLLARADRGSFTVEAAIVLPFFLFIFLFFLFVSKALYIQAALDRTVQETVQELAAVTYPLSFFNEWEDETLTERILLQKASKTSDNPDNEQLTDNYQDFIGNILSGNLAGVNLLLSNGSAADPRDLLRKFSDAYIDLQSNGKYAVAEKVISERLKMNNLDDGKFVLGYIHLPESDLVYNYTSQESVRNETGLLPGCDFQQDDVVIQARYVFTIPLPFLSDNTIMLKSTCIEKAWLRGGNGIYTDGTDKGIFEQVKEEINGLVYVTKTGVKYHRNGCHYLRKSKIPLACIEAKKSYQPCKVCQPP